MTRIIVGAVLAIAILAAIWFLPAAEFRWLVLIVIAIGLAELTRMRLDDAVERWTVIIGGLIVATALSLGLPHPAALLIIVGVLFVYALVIMWRSTAMEGAADRLGFAVLAMIYLSVAVSFWTLLRNLDGGRWWVLLAVAPACLCDTFAFLVGKAVGRRKLAPMVSPKKTVEGFIGALAGSVAGTAAVVYAGGRWIPLWHAAILALAMWLVSPMGDLIESMIKRSCGVKDSGTVIKGHGGVLDRLDALVFAGALVFVYAKYIAHAG